MFNSFNKSPIVKVLQVLMLLTFACVPFFACIVMVQYGLQYPQHFSLKELPILILSCIFYIWMFKSSYLHQLSEKTLTFCSFLITNIVMVLSLLSFDTQPCSDYLAVFDGAKTMADGNFNIHDLDEFDYFNIVNYQIGITYFESLIFRVFGQSMIALQILNILLINLTLWLAYKISRILGDERSAAYSLLLLSTFYPILITVNQFTNQHLAAPMILTILLCIRHKGVGYWILAALLTLTLNFLRPMGEILVITAIIYCLLLLFKHKVGRLNNMVNGVLFLIIFVVGQKCIDYAMVKYDYCNQSLSQKTMPYFKYHRGLTGYSTLPTKEFGSIENFNNWEKETLIETAKNRPMEIIGYVTTKMIRYLGEFDWKFENTYNHNPTIYNKYPIKGFVMFRWAQYIIYAILAAYGYYLWSKKNGIGPFQIFYLGITYAYLFVEAFSSYRYESYPILFAFAGIGVSLISKNTLKKFQFVLMKKLRYRFNLIDFK